MWLYHKIYIPDNKSDETGRDDTTTPTSGKYSKTNIINIEMDRNNKDKSAPKSKNKHIS